MAKGRPDYRHGHDLEAQAIDRISTIAKVPTGGTSIFKTGRIENGTALVHTVTADKTLFLTGTSMGAFSLDASADGTLTVRDDVNTEQYHLLRANVHATTDNSANVTYTQQLVPPIEIPAGWDIVVISDNANLNIVAFITGWEE